MSTRKGLVLALALLVIGLAGCIPVGELRLSIYDKDKEIARQWNTYSYKDRISGDSLRYSEFSGTDTIHRFDLAREETVEISIRSSVAAGRFKCVLITPSNEIIILVEHTDERELVINLPPGVSRIKLVGYRASGEFSLSISGEVRTVAVETMSA